MLTRRIDDALDALAACRTRLPPLRDVYRAGTPERAVLDDLIGALKRTDEVLLPRADAPSPQTVRR